MIGLETAERQPAAPQNTTPEVSVDTLAGRRFALENEMFEAAALLSKRLHQAETAVADVQGHVHQLVCQSGRVPIEDKTRDVLRLVAELAGRIGASETEKLADRVEFLKARVEQLEQALLERRHSSSRAPAAVA